MHLLPNLTMAGSGIAPLRDDPGVLLRVRNLVVEFPAPHGATVQAVSDVSFDVLQGETLGLVGESGCGKTTTGLAIMRLHRPKDGSVEMGGTDLAGLEGKALRRLRSQFQMIFQEPLSSLNPRRKVRDIVAEPLRIWSKADKNAWDERVDAMLDEVGLDAAQVGDRHPREFSGGQAQRISIARALILNPSLIVCDEPVSSLDVSIQAQIINLLQSMKEKHRLTLIFISHDLAVVRNVSDRLAVMYLGKLCEIGDADTIYTTPVHPYTRALLDSVPRLDVEPSLTEPPLGGDLPSPIDPPSGCRFRTRCPAATDICAEAEPTMRQFGADHYAACHHPLISSVDVPVAITSRSP